jgi:hypothetical protein
MAHEAYLVGRDQASLERPFDASDKLFAANRIDGQKMDQASFEHCTFANVSFKEVTIKNGQFLNCTFIGCYLRRATITDCRFTGCKFIECNFSHAAITGSDFRYSSFRDCYVPWESLEHNLPLEPNLRAELTRNLSIEAAKLGAIKDSRLYRRCEIQSNEEHLSAAVRGQTEWYRQHFDGWHRIVAAFEWLLSTLNGIAWGYGERSWVLIRNYLLLSLVVFPVLFLFVSEGLVSRNGKNIGFMDAFYFSLQNMLHGGIESGIQAATAATRFCAGLESTLGVIMAGLLASYVFRWSLRR